MKTEKTKRIIGDRAENSKPCLCRLSAMNGMFEITLDTHFIWECAGNGHAAKWPKRTGQPKQQPQQTLQNETRKTQCLQGKQVVGQAAGWGHLLSIQLLPWALWL